MAREVNIEAWRNALEQHDMTRLRALVRLARPADVAEVIALLEPDDGLAVLRALPRNVAALVLSLLPEAIRSELVDDLSDQFLADLLTHLPPDDAADLLGELPAAQARELLKNTLREESEKLQELMSYGEETAGGLMTPAMIAMPATATIGQAVAEIRRVDFGEEFFNVYVTDHRHRLIGIVPLVALVTRPEETPLGRIMQSDLVTVRTDEDQEVVVNLCRKYDLSAVPVVDAEGRLLGRITSDDILDAAEEEAAEDLFRMAGTDPAELETTSTLRAVRIRGVWLLPCVAGVFMISALIMFFEAHLAPLGDAVLVLVLAFVPAVMAMGGNTGIQTSTGVVRALALGGLAESHFRGALRRELPIGAVLAVGFGVLAGVVAAMIGQLLVSRPMVGVAVGISMWLAISASTTLGVSLPFLFRRIGVDPAIASGPIITTSNDLIASAIYLSVATALL